MEATTLWQCCARCAERLDGLLQTYPAYQAV